MKKMNKKGFTIVELVIVIAVIAILAAVMIPTFSGLVEKANESAALQAADAKFTEDLILLEGQATNYAEYFKTEDTAVVEGKTYYTKAADAETYTAVETPAVADIATYYEASPCAGKFTVAADGSYTYTVEVDDVYTATFANGEWTLEK